MKHQVLVKMVFVLGVILLGAFYASRNNSSILGITSAAYEITVEKDIPYGTLPKQKLDLCKPANVSDNLPGVIIIHGGGGDKSQHTTQCKALAKKGIVVIAINYRESPAPAWKVVLGDSTLAYNWLISREDVDSGRIGSMGGSLGGYVASMFGVTSELIDKPICVENNYGPTDFTDPGEWDESLFLDYFIDRFFGVTYDENPTLYTKLSPITHVSSDDAGSWLFTRSTNDQLIPRTQMTKMIAALNSVGITTEFYEYDGTGTGHANKLSLLQSYLLLNKRIEFMSDCLYSK